MKMAKINVDYLLRLANNEIKNAEILSGYMKYYVAQGRNIGDMKHDYMRICNNPEYLSLKSASLSEQKIKQALNKTRKVLDTYLVFNFNCRSSGDIEL